MFSTTGLRPLFTIVGIVCLLAAVVFVPAEARSPRQAPDNADSGNSGVSATQSGGAGKGFSVSVFWWLGYRSSYRTFGSNNRWFYIKTNPYFFVGLGPLDRPGFADYESP
ncbi:uncharacterized protein LOC108680348 [Hyalella azteca]|uniref:Uncharacterized protein LOC108680348 n=1 Tax=Hyalella azteca TaxID=294128 RepID=A0A8B7PES6_HYAAZ|nr:uncharacterized protein LOC108680348 [Hyalella azteca]